MEGIILYREHSRSEAGKEPEEAEARHILRGAHRHLRDGAAVGADCQRPEPVTFTHRGGHAAAQFEFIFRFAALGDNGNAVARILGLDALFAAKLNMHIRQRRAVIERAQAKA